MADTSRSPGPVAERAFESGFKTAILGGLVGIGSLYWTDVLSTANGLHTTLFRSPGSGADCFSPFDPE